MANLKDLKLRIRGVKSTQKITKAMRMVAAARLRKAQEQISSAKPYLIQVSSLVKKITLEKADFGNLELVSGRARNDKVLILVMTSDRGLCGPFNSSITREVTKLIKKLDNQDKEVQILIIGKKGYELLKPKYGARILDSIKLKSNKEIDFTDAKSLAEKLMKDFESALFDSCYVVYNYSKNILSQEVKSRKIIPFSTIEEINLEETLIQTSENLTYAFEPGIGTILKKLLPHHLAVQIYYFLMCNNESEHAARMTAMENATNNAKDMINRLTLEYNRKRQAAITKELIEIISGSEAI